MNGMKIKKYMHTPRKRFDPISLLISTVGLVGVLVATGVNEHQKFFLDIHSAIIIIGGTLASLLFQYDIVSIAQAAVLLAKSFLGTPDKPILKIFNELDKAILTDGSLLELRDGQDLTGELLNDIVYMRRQGLLYEEIDAFVTSRISDEYFQRHSAASMMRKAAAIAPALGLLGTVIGLVGVLKSLQNPQNIGSSMSLALTTTAYGAAFNSLIFTPIAGRLEHHNEMFLEAHKQLLNKVSVLIKRDERRTDRTHQPEGIVA